MAFETGSVVDALASLGQGQGGTGSTAAKLLDLDEDVIKPGHELAQDNLKKLIPAHPVNEEIQRTAEVHGDKIGLCAHDLAFSVSKLKNLRNYNGTFARAKRGPGLRLKPQKNQITLAALRKDAFREESLRSRLEAITDDETSWNRSTIAGSFKYLGYQVGPSTGDEQWASPLRKCFARCDELRHSKLGLLARLQQVKVRAMSISSRAF